MLFQPYMIWFIVGLVLTLSEFAMPGIILIFMGLGAWLVAFTAWIEWTPTLASQMTVFTIGSLVFLVGLRRFFTGWFMGLSKNGDARDAEEEFAGKEVKVVSAIAGGRDGKVEFKGASWNARSDDSLEPGSIAIIVSREGLTLTVRLR
jgi:membrane protein implicated in regulation of membrane protease activity